MFIYISLQGFEMLFLILECSSYGVLDLKTMHPIEANISTFGQKYHKVNKS